MSEPVDRQGRDVMDKDVSDLHPTSGPQGSTGPCLRGVGEIRSVGPSSRSPYRVLGPPVVTEVTDFWSGTRTPSVKRGCPPTLTRGAHRDPCTLSVPYRFVDCRYFTEERMLRVDPAWWTSDLGNFRTTDSGIFDGIVLQFRTTGRTVTPVYTSDLLSPFPSFE